MKEGDPIQLNRDLDAVNYQAQKAIMDKTISEFRKDFIVEEAVKKITQIGEQRQEYKAKE